MNGLADLLAGPILGWMPQLTLLFLLANQPWRKHMPLGSASELFGRLSVVLAAVGLLIDNAAASPWFWYALTATHMSWVVSSYFMADNHYYLIGYWCLAVSLALHVGGPHGEQLLARNAEVLLGLCFGVAVLAKLASRAYRDGSFFTWELVADQRFLPLATLAGRLTPELRRRHADARMRVLSGASARETAPIPLELRWLALSLTWWTIAIESAIALLFLLPIQTWPALEWPRVVALSLFALTTFTFVAVPAFGQILLVMLLAATADATLRWYVVLLVLFLGVVSFIPHLAKRLALVAHKARTAHSPEAPLPQTSQAS
jgi:hypothetical protein